MKLNAYSLSLVHLMTTTDWSKKTKQILSKIYIDLSIVYVKFLDIRK